MYYVVYKYYTEWNQFEGSWDQGFTKSDSYETIKTAREGYLSSGYYTDVSPILVEAKPKRAKKIPK